VSTSKAILIDLASGTELLASYEQQYEQQQQPRFELGAYELGADLAQP
jgi:hypothetical protein